jgi:hypothetical protein
LIKVIRNFLTQTECDNIVAEVKSRKDSWKFYDNIEVLGNSFYRIWLNNGRNAKDAWETYSAAQNVDIMDELFRSRISAHVNYDDVRFTQHFSRPGFQIITKETPRNWHYDDDKLHYPYAVEFPDYKTFDYFDDAYTFTLMLTEGNFTYEYYPQTQSRYRSKATYYCQKHHELYGDDCDCDLKNPIKIVYQKGDLILAKNRQLHRVGPSTYKTDERITLQGSGVVKNKVLYIYW